MGKVVFENKVVKSDIKKNLQTDKNINQNVRIRVKYADLWRQMPLNVGALIRMEFR